MTDDDITADTLEIVPDPPAPELTDEEWEELLLRWATHGLLDDYE